MSEHRSHEIIIGKTDVEKQAELTEQGRRLGARVMSNIDGLVANGAMAPKQDGLAERRNQAAYSTVGTPGLGLWRQIAHDRAVRVNLVAPKRDENGLYTSAEGYLHVDFAKVGLKNGKPNVEPGQGSSNVRVGFDEDGTGHVNGRENGYMYSVDQPNTAAIGHDFPAAARMLEQAEDAVDVLLAMPQPSPAPEVPGRRGEGNPPIILPL